ncbi:protein YIPF5 homolog [Cryptotermes secundus]|uniref:protein YIPF5 homolog n=1 Tax=Cryptotermes secundus TaxID=105785 RepID=UPI000CD7B134|nr:protein YIPF5 homolog [Cryptotermes secundus]
MAEYHNKNNEFKLSWDSPYPSDYKFHTNKMGNNSGTSLQTARMEGGSTNIPGLSYFDPVLFSQDPYDGYTSPLSSAQCYNNSGTSLQTSERMEGGNINNSGRSYFDPSVVSQDTYDGYTGQLSSDTQRNGTQCEFEEPPLLEELGIDTDRIIEKSVAVLNPFYSDVKFNVNIMYETDLAGPAALCILLGACLFLAGSKAHFGYVYGIVVIGCIAMCILLTLMTTEGSIPLGSVPSVLGYCLLPVVILSVLGIFLPLYGPVGFMCAALAVMWSSLSASKLFVMMSGDPQQRYLIAYPCVLLYGAFALAVVF